MVRAAFGNLLGVFLASVWRQFGDGLVSCWGRFGGGLGSIWGRFGVGLGSFWGGCGGVVGAAGARLGGVLGASGEALGIASGTPLVHNSDHCTIPSFYTSTICLSALPLPLHPIPLPSLLPFTYISLP